MDPNPDEMSEGEKIARAVVEQLNGASLSVLLDPIFQFNVMPDFDLKDLEHEVIATVRDINEEMAFAGGSRSMTRHEYFIEVCLRRLVTHESDVRVSQTKLLLQQIAEYFRFRELTGRTERFIRAENRTIMSDEAMKVRGVVKASITLVFQGWRK